MMHKIRNLTQTIKEEADRQGISHEHKQKALEIFLEGYEKHKAITGSFRHLTEPLYSAKMAARYDYMFNESFKYIQTCVK